MKNIAENNSNSESKDVRERLLDAAEGFFAEKGFEGTSVRDLTATAGSNIAAVNYYFGGKEKLYIEVFHRRMVAINNVRINGINQLMSRNDHEVTLEILLRTFAMSFLEPLLDQSSGRRFIKLMVREMLDSHLPERMFLDEMFLPVFAVFNQALMKVNPVLNRNKIELIMHSIIGQLVHAIRLQEMFNLDKDSKLQSYDLQEIVEHIVEFSAAGIRAAAKKGN
jgi:AcrR family transcriptional regulator